MRSTLAMAACLWLAAGALPSQDAGPQDAPRRITDAEQVQVSLVLIDVVVRDRKDNPVSGLTLDDFELIVDSVPVAREEIETFEEVCRATAPQAAASAQQAPTQPAGPSMTEPRAFVVYLDFSNMTVSGRRLSLRAVRTQLAARIGPEDRVMILAYKRGLRLVQDFTSDRELLTARIDEMLAESLTQEIEVIEESQNLSDVASKPCDPSANTCQARRMAADVFAAQEEMRARRTLGNLERLMPALSALPGRKALLLFTDVLREEPGIQYFVVARTTPQQEGVLIAEQLLRLTREANAAGVSFYTVHANGLDDSSVEHFRSVRDETRVSPGDRPDIRSETLNAARAGLDSALALQTMLAVETGGRALQRTNNVGQIVAAAQEDLSCYYVLGYRHAARGDDKRHSLLVRLRSDGSGEPRRGLTVRHRPYYTDSSPRDRTERLMRSAMDIPDLYRDVPVTGEAFALAPLGEARRVLIKATAPLSALSWIPADGSQVQGRVLARGEVTSGDTVACRFENEVPLRVPRASADAGELVYETGCVLEEGRYDLTMALMDVATRDVGALRTALHVPEARSKDSAYLSEVHLWTKDPAAVVVSAGAGRIGIKEGTLQEGFIPRAERIMVKGQDAMLTFLLCPLDGTVLSSDSPIRIRRTLQGEGNRMVADFRDLVISEPPDPESGCYQIINTIPAATLGDGVYTFLIELRGAPLGMPLTRQAALSVH